MPLALLGLTAAGVGLAFVSEGYSHFILALVALTAVVGVGLNVLLGLAGQVSLGHVGFYAIGAYTAAILTVKGVSFWLAFPLGRAGCRGDRRVARATGATRHRTLSRDGHHRVCLHRPPWHRRMEGPDRRTEWPDGSRAACARQPHFGEREMALMAILLAGLSLYLFHRIAASAWGKAMVAVRESETAARSVGLNPVSIKTVAFAISAVFAGLAGAIFAPLMMFVAPDSFPFSQSILFLLAVIVGGSGWVIGPVVGAVVTVLIPEMLSHLAEYRLLMVGVLLLVVLWLAPEGIVGTLARYLRRTDGTPAQPNEERAVGIPVLSDARHALTVSGIGIAFGGVKAASGVSFTAQPGRITSVIGPNGAGKTTVLNIIGGFYRPRRGEHTARRHRACRRAGLAHRPHRHRAHLPDRATVRHDECAGQCTCGVAARTARQPLVTAPRRRTTAISPKRSSPSSAITARSLCWRTLCRTSIAASSRSRARSPPGRACCCLTSPPPA